MCTFLMAKAGSWNTAKRMNSARKIENLANNISAFDHCKKPVVVILYIIVLNN